MRDKIYGISAQTVIESAADRYLEELSISGYTIIENVLGEKELITTREKLDMVYSIQEKEFTGIKLSEINEQYLVRLPLMYDEYFLSLAVQPTIIEIIKKSIGNYFLLHLQNGIINMPGQEHHQGSWHRDLPHQDFKISKPIAVSALFCIDDFTAETGATFVIPFSHQLEKMPSKEYIHNHAVQATAKAGSVILFDSMLFHKAGYNSSHQIRRGINHVYAAGILRQQINIPSALRGKYSDDIFLRMLLGYDARTPDDVIDWRNNRYSKMNKK